MAEQAWGNSCWGPSLNGPFDTRNVFVATVGPGAHEESLVENNGTAHTFLFPTDFGDASLQALPYAMSFASRFGAKLIALHVLPVVPVPKGFHWSTTGDLTQIREKAKADAQKQFELAISHEGPKVGRPEFAVRFGIPSDQILLASQALKADLIIFGLTGHSGIQTTSHKPWDAAYFVCEWTTERWRDQEFHLRSRKSLWPPYSSLHP
jgi:nucleotide-binding universal stress UspA family protein